MRFLSLGLLTICGAVSICAATAKEKMVIGYFPNWLYNNYPSSNIPFEKYTHINYAFALQNHDDGVPFFQDDWAIENYLPKLIQSAHSADTKVLLSIGGWTGSEQFSPMVASPDLRERFVDWNLNFIEKYNTDGVDIDWEYPGKQAAGCNTFNENDTDNLLLLLKELRSALDKKFPDDHKEISMAVYVLPFLRNGEPSTDLSDFVPYFDHINLMTYDINGAWAPLTGPNAPFHAEKNKGADYSFANSIQAWKAAGVPSEKINAGLAFYGRSMQAITDMTDTKSQYQEALVGAPKGDSDDAYWANPFCAADIDGLSGVWKWSNLRSQGLIQKNTSETGDGWIRHWDDHSKTPWLFNPASKLFISYDDPESLQIKVDYVGCEELGGVMIWDIHQDNGELIEVVNKVHQLPTCIHKLSVGNDGVPPTSTHTVNEVSPSSKASAFVSSPALKSFSVTPLASKKLSVAASKSRPSATVLPVAIDKTPKHGSLCSTLGKESCTENGKSEEWLTCDVSKVWVSRKCAQGLVCYNAQAGILCDRPHADRLEVESEKVPIGKAALAVEPITGDLQ